MNFDAAPGSNSEKSKLEIIDTGQHKIFVYEDGEVLGVDPVSKTDWYSLGREGLDDVVEPGWLVGTSGIDVRDSDQESDSLGMQWIGGLTVPDDFAKRKEVLSGFPKEIVEEIEASIAKGKKEHHESYDLMTKLYGDNKPPRFYKFRQQ